MEIEAKFRAPDAATLRRLGEASHLAGFPIFAGRTEQLRDTYLDTDEWRLLEDGYACRRRRVENRILITVKQVRDVEDAVHRREELEVGLPADLPPADWPESEARTKVLGVIHGRPLVDKLSLRQTRSSRWVGTIDHPLAELSLDEVHLEPSGTVYFEVELELMEAGTEADLATLVRGLATDWRLEPEPLSKFERALAVSRSNTGWRQGSENAHTEATAVADGQSDRLQPHETGEPQPDEATGAQPDGAIEQRPDEAAEAPPSVDEPGPKQAHQRARRRPFLGDGGEVLTRPSVDADDTMGAAANKLLLYHLQRMMKHEPGTREGEDPEQLHDMRVATRRMRAVLRVFADYLDTAEYKPFLKLVRTTGRELGAVRDLDVFRIKTDTYVDSLPPNERSGLNPLMEAWADERERARAELIRYLDSNRFQRLKEQFEHFLRTPGAGAGPAIGAAGEPLPNRVGDVLPAILFRRLATVRAFDRVITQPDAPLARFHELRIASKGLRYTLEFFQEVLGPGSKPLIETMKVVQDHLGDLQDAVVTCDVLLGFLGSGTWGPPRLTEREGRLLRPVNAPGVAAYLAVKQNEIETLMGTFAPVWEQVQSSQFSRPLAALVGEL